MQYLHLDEAGLCTRANDVFKEWLDGMQDKIGPTCKS